MFYNYVQASQLPYMWEIQQDMKTVNEISWSYDLNWIWTLQKKLEISFDHEVEQQKTNIPLLMSKKNKNDLSIS